MSSRKQIVVRRRELLQTIADHVASTSTPFHVPLKQYMSGDFRDLLNRNLIATLTAGDSHAGIAPTWHGWQLVSSKSRLIATLNGAVDSFILWK